MRNILFTILLSIISNATHGMSDEFPNVVEHSEQMSAPQTVFSIDTIQDALARGEVISIPEEYFLRIEGGVMFIDHVSKDENYHCNAAGDIFSGIVSASDINASLSYTKDSTDIRINPKLNDDVFSPPLSGTHIVLSSSKDTVKEWQTALDLKAIELIKSVNLSHQTPNDVFSAISLYDLLDWMTLSSKKDLSIERDAWIVGKFDPFPLPVAGTINLRTSANPTMWRSTLESYLYHHSPSRNIIVDVSRLPARKVLLFAANNKIFVRGSIKFPHDGFFASDIGPQIFQGRQSFYDNIVLIESDQLKSSIGLFAGTSIFMDE